MSDPILRALVDLRDKQIQKARIQFSNRLSAIERRVDESDGSGQRATVERWLEVFTTLEKQLDKDIAQLVKPMPIYEEMSNIKGLGPLLSAKLLAMIDIEIPGTVAALWQYCGYGQEEYYIDTKGEVVAPVIGMKWTKKKPGKGVEILRSIEGKKFLIRTSPTPEPDWTIKRMISRPVSGWMLSYNKRVKTTLYIMAGSFIKSGSPYRGIYDDYKVEYERKHPDWTKMHNHLAATRKMIKIFLSHFWTRWRTLEGLPVTEPYVFRVLGHSKDSFYPSKDFGWSK